MCNSLVKCDIKPGTHSDHSILWLELNTNKEVRSRGRGVWNFNNTLLHDSEYVQSAKMVIKESAKNYEYLEDKGLVWELIKHDIRAITISYSIANKTQKWDQT